jgi:UDP-N-acetylmuramate--alanine ligase
MPKNFIHFFTKETGVIHFIGIGGIGMSGIAGILHDLGYSVQGSDMIESYITEGLRKAGINVIINHNAANIENATLIVKSTDIKDDNIEIIAAKKLNIPIIKRSEMLAEIMRFKYSISISGTHGKTTTTSMIASIFEAAGMHPTVINGGIINTTGTNAYLGSGDYLIAEADESDGTFIRVPSYVGVITNIDPEHLNYYKTFRNVKSAFRTFIESLPFYGFGVLCYDHKVVRNLGKSITDRRVISYAVNYGDVDFKATNIVVALGSFKMWFDVEISEKYQKLKKLDFSVIEDLQINTPGLHNIQNALAAISIAVEKGFDTKCIRAGLSNFAGVKRRFTKVGEVDGIIIIDDYAHHPVEIEATLKTAALIKQDGASIIAIVQPHRYTRLQTLMDEFRDAFHGADYLIISDVYPAGELPIPGITSDELIKKIKLKYNKEVIKLDNLENLPNIINKLAKRGDIVIFLGAGNVTKWAYELPQQLQKIKENV